MTDYSGWTDERINIRIAEKTGWQLYSCTDCGHDWWMTPDGGVDYNQTDPPYYTHDWRLAGELLEEFATGGKPVGYVFSTSNIKRAICEAWLAWKEQG